MALMSKSCEYGLRAVLYVASRKTGDGRVSIKEISRELGISFHFLTKILQKLTQQGVLRSCRGPGGGVALAKPAGSIHLLEIIKAIDEKDVFGSCVLGLKGCSDKNPCPLHHAWARERARIEKMFRAASLQDMARPIARGSLRLGNRRVRPNGI